MWQLPKAEFECQFARSLSLSTYVIAKCVDREVFLDQLRVLLKELTKVAKSYSKMENNISYLVKYVAGILIMVLLFAKLDRFTCLTRCFRKTCPEQWLF
jgi:hypothetical protein